MEHEIAMVRRSLLAVTECPFMAVAWTLIACGGMWLFYPLVSLSCALPKPLRLVAADAVPALNGDVTQSSVAKLAPLPP